MRPLLAAFALLSMLTAALAQADVAQPLSQADRDYLEGYWVVVTGNPAGGVCPDLGVDAEAYEIEFRRTGGSILFGDSVDFGSRVDIVRAFRSGRTIHLYPKDSRTIRLRPAGRNVMIQESGLSEPYEDDGSPARAYRCARARHADIAAVPADLAKWLTNKSPGAPYFVKQRAGASEFDLCREAYRPPNVTLKFEVIGPSRFRIAVWANEHYEMLSILRAREAGAGAITFDVKDESPMRTFTISRNGDRVHVRELAAEFVHCTA
jgi:hypothetical protein